MFLLFPVALAPFPQGKMNMVKEYSLRYHLFGAGKKLLNQANAGNFDSVQFLELFEDAFQSFPQLTAHY